MAEDQWNMLGDSDDKDPASRSSGVMVIRTWYERGHPKGFRARLTYGHSAETQQMVTTADPAEVLQVVKRWIASQAENS